MNSTFFLQNETKLLTKYASVLYQTTCRVNGQSSDIILWSTKASLDFLLFGY